MSHLPILPILVPFIAAAVLLLAHGRSMVTKRAISLTSIAALSIGAAWLLTPSNDDATRVYRLGTWPAPFGIVLMLDRLSALMVSVTAILGLAVLASAMSGADRQGRHFHAFLQLELAGLNGAFLTGDLFNLFVFFEILLLASYALLVHGGGLTRTRAGLGYVILNLAGSALFLVSLGLVYGTLGTLNMADLSLVLTKVAAADQPLVRTALALMVAVFVLKAALLPLGFWLPGVYTAATLPVSVLFVIMTKVGIYALLRLSTIGLATAPFTAGLLQPWLPWLAIGTIALGSLGALAARRFAVVVANLVMISSGTLLLAVADGSPPALAAALYYMTHSTLVTAALFLMSDLIARQRGAFADRLETGPRIATFMGLGAVYLVLAVAVSGAPPLSGFLAKLMVMQSLAHTPTAVATWAALLISGLVVALVLARAASVIFWEPEKSDAAERAPAPSIPIGIRTALVLMLAGAPLLAVAASPFATYARAAAGQLTAPARYVEAVIGPAPRIERGRRP